MKKQIFSKIKFTILSHKIWSTLIILAILGVSYYTYGFISTKKIVPQYVLSRASLGSITEVVTGTGQVSASNQLDIQSQVSGMINTIDVSVGDHVDQGKLLVTIDSKQAYNSLQNARIALSKLTAPPKSTDLSSAENTLSKSYTDAFNSISGFFLDTPAIMAGLKDIFYSQGGFLQDPNASLPASIRKEYRDSALTSFDSASIQYTAILQKYKSLNRFSATSDIEELIDQTYLLAKNISGTLQKTQSAVNYISTTQPSYNASLAPTTATNINSWSSTVNSQISSLSSSQNSIDSAKNALLNLKEGTDPLDIQSQELSLSQQQQTYENYFIRAPFSGTVGRIPVNIYEQAGNGTTIATLIGDEKISVIPLNEVDAAKVHTGNRVDLTFDAIEGLNATGTVSAVDLVGTVSQGIVSYNVKITLNTSDPRILPGMSVNASIITKEINNVLVVPSGAVKS
jgi:HlyD family secretion protein